MVKKYTVGILLFNEVEVLDFAGPFEVFSYASFSVKTVAQTKDLINARNGLKIQSDYDFCDAPNFDILIIPGGYGASEIEINNPSVINWIKEQLNSVEIMASVCTGAFLLAKSGLLNGKQVTTHWRHIDRLEKEYTEVQVKRNIKYVDEGSIITSFIYYAAIVVRKCSVKKCCVK